MNYALKHLIIKDPRKFYREEGYPTGVIRFVSAQGNDRVNTKIISIFNQLDNEFGFVLR